MPTELPIPSALDRGEFVEHMLNLPLSSLEALGRDRGERVDEKMSAPLLEGQELELREEGVRVRHEDAVLGTLVLDATNECWSCEKEVSGTLVEVCVRLEEDSLSSDGGQNAASGIAWKELGAVWERAERSARAAREFAADELLLERNRDWRTTPEGGEEAEVGRGEFLGRLQLREVWLEADGSASLWHEDSDLFWGHRVVVELDARGVPSRAWLAG